MSYIGKNPEADSVKLKGSATEPSGTAVDGQVYFNTGAGSISKGMKVYKNSQFVAIDKQLGDADTMQLLKAADIPAIDFSLSLTSTTVGGQGAVPFESSTGDFDGTAAFTNSSTGDALLTDDSADLVFHYTTQATNNANNDFWGIPLTVPRAFRGGNLVVEFKYRTEIATGTMDNDYFNIAIQDRSSMILQTQDSTISAGAIAAGANVLLDGKTYANPVTGTTLTVAVGDRVFVESGTGTAGSQTNDIVDCYITEVSGTDNNVKLSKDIVAVQDGKFVTGWLTGYDTGGQIDAFASDTNKDGTSKKIAFKTDADTQQVSLWFFVKGTSTVKHELFFDNVLLSGNQFLQVSSQTKDENYNFPSAVNFLAASGSGDKEQLHANLLSASATSAWSLRGHTPVLANSKLINIYDVSTQTRFEALQDIEVSVDFYYVATDNSMPQIKNSSGGIIALSENDSGNSREAVSSTFLLNKGDYFTIMTPSPYSADGAMSLNLTPKSSPAVVLESQDEIFTDWNSFDAGPLGFGTVSKNVWFWKRVGDTMEIMGSFVSGSPSSTQDAEIYLPSGYSIDMAKCALSTNFWNAGIYTKVAGANYLTATAHSGWIFVIDSTPDRLYLAPISDGDNGNIGIEKGNVVSAGTGQGFTLSFKVPIQGWNSNFNPLLSMPLVEIGANKEEGLWETAAGYGTAANKTQYFTNETYNRISNLGTVVNNSTDGWKFTASQRVKVNAVQVVASSASGAYWGWSLNSTSITTDITSLSFANGRRVVQGNMGSNYIQTIPINLVMEPGDVLRPQGGASTINLGAYQSMQLVVEKDFSNTNMAHIIKPAVAQARHEVAQNTQGGTATTGSWQIRTINLLRGETWFVTLDSNKLTFQPGTYKIQASAFFTNVSEVKIMLYDNTNSAVLSYGQNGYNIGAYSDASQRWVSGLFTFTESTDVYIKYWVSANNGTCDLGQPNNFSGVPEIYLNCLMEKLK